MGAHHWEAGLGRPGPRGVRCDRCRRCGLNRAKKNGLRAYSWNDRGVSHWMRVAPACDPKRLQLVIEL